MMRAGFHFFLIGILTLLTQVGGLAWFCALFFKRRFLTFTFAYVALSLSAVFIAPSFGRVALPCHSGGPMKMQSVMYCALNRHYVVPEMRDVLSDTASEIARIYPGTLTLILDASFPFFDTFPLLPHLSHDDGQKADIAFYYQSDGAYLPGKTRSPVGYFAFENGMTTCPPNAISLRWNARALQPLWPDWQLEPERTRAVMRILANDLRVGKMFIEPHLTTRLQISSEKIRFQGCRAARHDDHIHVQL
ncbi:MAG: hypothetical protein ABJF50_07985 [Paracoccaceae bacterium]